MLSLINTYLYIFIEITLQINYVRTGDSFLCLNV